VPKALVPPPGVVVVAGCKAHELCYLHMDDAEAIGASIHLGEKATMVILDAQEFVLDLHA
jgi:hypothetical protein